MHRLVIEIMKLYSFTVAIAVSRTTALLIPPQQVLDHRIQNFPSVHGAQAEHTSSLEPIQSASRKLTGRFLHITDIHPDPYYKVYSSTDEAGVCHRGKGVAGYYGAETSDCDSPLTLVNATFAWIKKHIRDDIDFVVWTGDSARHDNDEDVPRSRAQVLEQNRLIEHKFREVFGRQDDDDQDPTNDFTIPIIPTFGNNDILPHNIFTKGPNSWTTRYLDIWRSMIPEAQRHNFARGGWFGVEVVPQTLTVFSLNTMYFFTSNGAVDGCAVKKEPGHEQFEWLRIQLDMVRARGMKAILIGHVPPARVDAKISWDETCWQKYALWMHQYRDIIIAGLYGHMNIDHFMIQDAQAIKKHVLKGYEYADEKALTETVVHNKSPEFSTTSIQDYLTSLRSAFARIPIVKANSETDDESDDPSHAFKKHKKKKPIDIGGEFAERYSLTFVAPSVVPNYFPALRVYTYNITGLESLEVPTHSGRHSPVTAIGSSRTMTDITIDEDVEDVHLELRSLSTDKNVHVDRKKKKKKRPRRFKFHVPSGPSSTSAPGPAYSPQPLTLISYKQYFANLTLINNDFTRDEGDEDKNIMANHNITSPISNGNDGWSFKDGPPEPWRWKPGKHHNKKPKHPKPQPLSFKYELEYDTSAEGDVYELDDLTIRSFLRLAARIAGKKVKGHDVGTERKPSKKDRAWYSFLSRAFVGALEPEDIEHMYEE